MGTVIWLALMGGAEHIRIVPLKQVFSNSGMSLERIEIGEVRIFEERDRPIFDIRIVAVFDLSRGT